VRSICPHDLLVRGRIHRNGVPNKPLAQTAKVDPQIAEILLGEVREVETRTLLDSFNTIHSGSPATIHANSADEALSRFADLVMRSHAQTTFSDTETEIGEAVDFVAHLERNREGEPFGRCCDSMVVTDEQSSSGLKPCTPVNQAPFRGASTMSKCTGNCSTIPIEIVSVRRNVCVASALPSSIVHSAAIEQPAKKAVSATVPVEPERTVKA